MKIQFLMILLIFIFVSLVSAFINMNSSFSDNEREFDVKWNSSLNFKLPDHSKPTFDDSETNFIWIIFGVFTVSTLLFGCFCCLVICWMIYGVTNWWWIWRTSWIEIWRLWSAIDAIRSSISPQVWDGNKKCFSEMFC